MKTFHHFLLCLLLMVAFLPVNRSQATTAMPVVNFKQALFYSVLARNIDTRAAQSANSPVTLRATVRDFTKSHPDFEDATTGPRPGLVRTTLGADGKPVFVGPDGSSGITSSETFDQWYNDVPGVNQSIELLLPLTETAPDSGNFTYKNNAFFPIDRQLFGNQGFSHNFHFTLELHATFVYQGGEVFTFFGDDDVWVFINDQLVVDLGGVHEEISGSVELDTLGLTIGESYSLDLFFAERHTPESHFGLTTSIVAETGPTYSITGRVTDESSAPISGVIVSIGQGLNTASGSDGRYTLAGIPDGSYILMPNKSGYTFSPESHLVSIPPDVTGLDFTGRITSSGALTIEVLAKTAEDHYLDTPLQCYRATTNSPMRCASHASTPLEVIVREASTKSPVQAQIRLLPDETAIGITSPSGLLSSQISIAEPAMAGENIAVVSADVNDKPVTSEPVILYRSESIMQSNSITLTQGEADAYIRLFPQEHVTSSELDIILCDALLAEACPQSQVAWLITELGGSDYIPMVDDVISEEVFRYTDPNGNVATAYGLVQKIQRQGNAIATQTVWSENSQNFTNRQIGRTALVIEVGSPIVLYITDSQGQGAGYNPTTQQVQFGFPIAISETGGEPYTLIVPNPSAGPYELQIIGIASGSFTVDVYELDQNGQATVRQKMAGDIDAGVVISCELNFDLGQDAQLLSCPDDSPTPSPTPSPNPSPDPSDEHSYLPNISR